MGYNLYLNSRIPQETLRGSNLNTLDKRLNWDLELSLAERLLQEVYYETGY